MADRYVEIDWMSDKHDVHHTQVLDDHRVLASAGSVGDAYVNALAESFVDSYKTELIADRAWRTHAQLEIATIEYIGWFNHARLHSSLANIPPARTKPTTRPRSRCNPDHYWLRPPQRCRSSSCPDRRLRTTVEDESLDQQTQYPSNPGQSIMGAETPAIALSDHGLFRTRRRPDPTHVTTRNVRRRM